HRERTASLAGAEQRLAEAAAGRALLEAQRAARAGEAAQHLELLRGAEAAAHTAAEQLEQYCGELEAALASREVHRLSLTLAQGLEAGQPCPVCGSEHHPSPASAQEDGERAVREEELQNARTLSKRIFEVRHSLRSVREQDSAWLEQIYGEDALISSVQAAATAEGLSESITGIGTASAAMNSNSEISSNLASVISEESFLTRFEAILLQRKQESAALRSAAAQWQTSVQDAQQYFHKESAAAEAERSWHAGLAAKAEEEQRQLHSLRQDWTSRFPDLAPEDAEKAYSEMLSKDEQVEEIRGRLEISVKFLDEKNTVLSGLVEENSGLEIELAQWNTQHESKTELLSEKEQRLQLYTGGQQAGPLLEECERRLRTLVEAVEEGKKAHRDSADKAQHDSKNAAIARQAEVSAREHHTGAEQTFSERLSASPFASAQEAETASLSPEERSLSSSRVRTHREQEAEVKLQLRHIDEKLDGGKLSSDEWLESEAAMRKCKEEDELALQSRARDERDVEDIRHKHIRWKILEEQRVEHAQTQDRLSKLQSCLRGNAFVEYIAEEQLMQVCQAASQRLRFLSKQRYALEVDSGGGFVIRDDGNGGVRRPVSTLSGGETFLTSLSLALALSAQIQLRGQYPLQFFFLDEGFGTLDPDLLDTVITSLEKLHNDQLSVGIISHVPELRARLPRKLVVVPAEHGGGGSRIILEKM
ncbi:SbcC/MukB-like Walker B domain-containing protein, partial [Paenibacillus sp. sgz500958]|uniref:SbcC/MukB-like Walker B domain-containing protein n=1 Tax=Paenibacillus sp. sgz500958 TaxID=3242475 RepID=UPI0036D26480